MLRRRLSKFTSVLSDINCVIGGLSFLAVFTGSLAAIIGVGGYSLEKLGVLKEEDTWEQVWAFAIVSSTVGLAGSSVAATSGALLNHLSEKIDKENNLDSSVLENCDPWGNPKTAFSAQSFKLAITHDMYVMYRDKEENKPLIYTYYFVQIEGNPPISGLMVSRMQSNSVAVCDCISFDDEERLMIIHQESFGENPILVGKSFSSNQPTPDKALQEYIDIHLSYIRAYQSKNFDLYNLRSCKGCEHLYGKDKIVCGMYPYGWNGIDCPDKVWDKRRIIRQFEDDAAIASLSKGLDNWKILKYDNFISLFHPQTYRQFSFDFDGQLLSYSKKLDGLEDANLVEYVNFFKRTRQRQYDYSCTDFIEQAELFLEEIDATIRVEDNRIIVRDNSNKVHIFTHNGSPIWVNNPACPQELKNDYNLPALIDFLYNGADTLNS